MKQKKTPNLKGISFESIPLDPQNMPTVCSETVESIGEDLRDMGKCRKRIKPKPKYIKGTRREGKRGPVRLLSRDEINDYEFERKLQMAKKRRSERTMRALAFLFDETHKTGELIGTEELAGHLEIPKSSASSIMTTVVVKMRDLIEDVFDDRKILRRVKDDVPFSNAREFVEEYYRRDGRKAKRKKRKVVTPRPLKPKPKATKSRDSMQRALMFIFASGTLEGDKRWVESIDVANALSISHRAAAGLVSRIDARMNDQLIIENIGVGKQKKFRRMVDQEKCTFTSPKEFADAFYQRGPTFDVPVSEKPVSEMEPEVTPEVEPEVDDAEQRLRDLEKEVREGVEDLASRISKLFADALNTVDRRVDLNLNVTGEVKFRFLFGGEK